MVPAQTRTHAESCSNVTVLVRNVLQAAVRCLCCDIRSPVPHVMVLKINGRTLYHMPWYRQSQRQRNTKSRFSGETSTTVRPSGRQGELGERRRLRYLLVSVYDSPTVSLFVKAMIFTDVPITFVQAALGGEITIRPLMGVRNIPSNPAQPDGGYLRGENRTCVTRRLEGTRSSH